MSSLQSPIKVLFVFHSLNHTGAPRALLNYILALDPARFSPVIFCLNTLDHNPLEEKIPDSIPVHFAPLWFSKLFHHRFILMRVFKKCISPFFSYSRYLSRLLHQTSPDLVFMNTIFHIPLHRNPNFSTSCDGTKDSRDYRHRTNADRF